MTEAQLAVKQNQEELREYLKDLGSWVREVKQKDQEYSTNAKSKERLLPPIRGSQVSASSSEAPTPGRPATSSRIASDDYRAWDQFAAKAADGGDDTPLPKPSVDSVKEANMEKDKGNAFFKSGDFDSAVKHYTKAISLDPSNPVMPLNRSMALIKKGDFRAAEADCSACLKLDPKNIKALWRRGIARGEIGKLEEAKEDLRQAAALDPANKDVRKELAKVEGMIASQPTTATKRRMKIEEVDVLPAPQPQADTKQSRRMKIEEVDSIDGTVSKEKSTIPEPATPSNSAYVKKEPVEPSKPPAEAPVPAAAPVPAEEAPASKPSRPIPPVPTSMLDFERDWRSLRNDWESLYAYFKSIDSKSLQMIMKGGLESLHFSQICTLLQKLFIERDTPETIVDVLKRLADLPRFSMCAMFMSKGDKSALSDVFAHLKNKDNVDQVELAKLQKLYGIA